MVNKNNSVLRPLKYNIQSIGGTLESTCSCKVLTHAYVVGKCHYGVSYKYKLWSCNDRKRLTLPP